MDQTSLLDRVGELQQLAATGRFPPAIVPKKGKGRLKAVEEKGMIRRNLPPQFRPADERRMNNERGFHSGWSCQDRLGVAENGLPLEEGYPMLVKGLAAAAVVAVGLGLAADDGAAKTRV